MVPLVPFELRDPKKLKRPAKFIFLSLNKKYSIQARIKIFYKTLCSL